MCRLLAVFVCGLALISSPARASDVERLEREVAELRTLVQELQTQVQALVRSSGESESPLDRALRDAEIEAQRAREGLVASVPDPGRGSTGLRLMDVSLDVLTSGGGSTAPDDELQVLQGGEHDPRQRGFNLQQVELSFLGAVDPYLTGEAHLIYFLDAEGESKFEIEEAFATTQALPYDLQVEFGQFFTRFGRANPTHPHAWTFADQPVVLSRLFGGDGIRNPGARVSWLPPTPWFSELSIGSQLARGETMVSFLANDEVFDVRPIGGLPFERGEIQSLSDLVWLGRLTNAFDVGEEWTSQLGFSGLLGPNASGPDADTQVWGVDGMAKWRPSRHRAGWPFVKLEGEWLYRRYQTDEQANDVGTLRDWGGYAQVEWGFRERWSLGLRGEYASGSGDGKLARSDDPHRQDRLRVSTLLSLYRSEFARWRLQYSYDRQRFLDEDDAHSLWLVLEFALGAHPAHRL